VALLRDVYRMLEAIVGPEHISEDPEITDVYAINCSTDEVQAIVIVCNRFKIKFKAHSTGWGSWANVDTEDAVLLDLRRMNRILEIDSKNQYAVVEPYVSWAQLMAETMKVGLFPNVIGAGSNTSVLASCTSMLGAGLTGMYTGFNGRNVLGVEWVLPTGEILKLGSLGAGAGWFCGEGPGPSARALMRGNFGAMGSLGVFTKCATKLYHWPGPSTFKIEGESPHYTLAAPIENCRVYGISFPSLENLREAMYKICDAEIAWGMLRSGPLGAAIAATPSNKEFEQLWERGIFQSRPYALPVLIMADTQREFEYKVRVLEDIIAEEGGSFGRGGIEPKEQARRQLRYLASDRHGQLFRLGSYSTSMGSWGTLDNIIRQEAIAGETKRPYVEKGLMISDDVGNPGIMMCEGHYGYEECMHVFDPTEPEGVEATVKFLEGETLQACLKHHFSLDNMGTFNLEGKALNKLGKACYNFHLWQSKILAALDPNGVTESGTYLRKV
jgi:glycolate oxidase